MAPCLFMKFLSKGICCSKLKTFHICNLLSHWALSNCCDPLWDTFHIPMIKITYTPHIFANFYTRSCARTFHPSFHIIPQNKNPWYSWLLSSSYHSKKKDMGYLQKRKKETCSRKHDEKKSWTHKGISIQKKKRRVGHLKVQVFKKRRER